MDMRQLWARLMRRWWLLPLGPLLALAVTLVVISFNTRTYEARTLLLVQQSQTPGIFQVSDVELSQILGAAYTQIIRTTPVLEELRSRINLPYTSEELKGKISASVVPDTQLLAVKARDPSPALAQTMANELAALFIDRVRTDQLQSIARVQAALAAAGFVNPEQYVGQQVVAMGSISLVETARLPNEPVGMGTVARAVLGLLLGTLATSGVALLWAYLDDRVYSPEDLSADLDLTVLSAVPRHSRREDLRRMLERLPRRSSTFGEAVRLLRTNLQFVQTEKPLRSFLVTSSTALEGKTTIAASVATALASTGKNVILVDADLRRPNLHKTFDATNEKGLSNLLISETLDVNSHLLPTPYPGLRLLPSGPQPPNPAELLGSSRMARTLEALLAVSDIVVFDSAPVLPVSDTLALASVVDGTILVLEMGRTKKGAILAAAARLKEARGQLLGLVLNKTTRRGGGYYYYSYYYRYGVDPSYGDGQSNHRGGRLGKLLGTLRGSHGKRDEE